MRQIDIAVFVHNEESTIESLIHDLSRQTALSHSDLNVRLRVLCNGCRDASAQVAQDAIQASDTLSQSAVVDTFKSGGKSLTWNRYVDELPDDSNVSVFMDGDIRLSDPEALRNLVDELAVGGAVAVTSRPVKGTGPLQRKPLLAAAATLTVSAHRDGPICGQLYAVKSNVIRSIRLPVPCLVDDGFLSACLVTDLFSREGMVNRVKASRTVSHSFDPPGSLREFFNHDVRLRLGVELNAALFTDLWAATTESERIGILNRFSRSNGIGHSIEEHLRHPERSALRLGFRSHQRRKRPQHGILGGLVRIPFRIAHRVYMGIVHLRARKLFLERQFEW